MQALRMIAEAEDQERMVRRIFESGGNSDGGSHEKQRELSPRSAKRVEKFDEYAQKSIAEVMKYEHLNKEKGEKKLKAACNISTVAQFEQMTGDRQLRNRDPKSKALNNGVSPEKRANGIYEHCISSEDWKEISGPSGLAELAAQGKIILAVWKNPNPGEMGHVVMISMCGEEAPYDNGKRSGEVIKKRWRNETLPYALDTGAGRRSAKYSLAASFPYGDSLSYRIKEIKYFIYKK